MFAVGCIREDSQAVRCSRVSGERRRREAQPLAAPSGYETSHGHSPPKAICQTTTSRESLFSKPMVKHADLEWRTRHRAPTRTATPLRSPGGLGTTLSQSRSRAGRRRQAARQPTLNISFDFGCDRPEVDQDVSAFQVGALGLERALASAASPVLRKRQRMPMIDEAEVAPDHSAGPIPPRFVLLHRPVPECRQFGKVGSRG